MSTVICTDGNNPYSNDADATESAPRTKETYEGRLYTKLSYEVRLNPLKRLANIIKVVALAVLSCFIALAFEQVRKLWTCGINGIEDVICLIPYLVVHVNDLNGRKTTLDIERDCKVAKLFTLLGEKLHKSPYEILLIDKNKPVSPFKNLHEYVSNDESEHSFHMVRRLGHWIDTAKRYPLMYEQAVKEAGVNGDTQHRFQILYEEAFEKALREI